MQYQAGAFVSGIDRLASLIRAYKVTEKMRLRDATTSMNALTRTDSENDQH